MVSRTHRRVPARAGLLSHARAMRNEERRRRGRRLRTRGSFFYFRGLVCSVKRFRELSCWRGKRGVFNKVEREIN